MEVKPFTTFFPKKKLWDWYQTTCTKSQDKCTQSSACTKKLKPKNKKRKKKKKQEERKEGNQFNRSYPS
jgi:hypothetical protein